MQLSSYSYEVVQNGSQFQFVAEAIPEPSVGLLISLAAGTFLIYRWRRMSRR